MKLIIIPALLFSLFIFNSCDRTPSRNRFETITKIELTDSINVIHDRFEDSGPDYGLFYKFKLNENDCLDLQSKIQQSDDWEKQEGNWTFYKTVDGIIYNITFSIQDCQISYQEDLI